jgi:PAS domain-containing protein
MSTTGSRADLLESSLLGEALATSSVPVLIWDAALRYLGGNDAARGLLGYTAAELLGLTARDIVVGLQRELESRPASLRSKSGRTIEVALVVTRATLGAMPVYVTLLVG